MPQKQNPIVSELIVASARTNATLLSAMHHGLIQEHERATHGWQLEWITLPQMLSLTANALTKALFLSQSLKIDADRMAQNIEASNGLILAEAVTFALVETMGRAEAARVVKEACHEVLTGERHLINVVREKTDTQVDWDRLMNSNVAVGASESFINNVLEQVKTLKR